MLPLRSAFLLGVLSLALPAQDYAIDLSRLKATEKLHGVVATATEENRMSVVISGQPTHTESRKSVVKLKADVEELGKDAAGLSRLKVSILDLDCTVDGRKAELGSIGSVLMAEYKDKQTVFTGPDGKSLPEEAQRLLRLVVSISDEPGSDDRAFGTKERKKVGDSWGIDKAWAASSLQKFGAKVEPENITGSVQLKEIVKDQGVDCMRVAVTMDLRDVKGIPLPEGVHMTKSVIYTTMSGLFPLDPTKDKRQSSEDFSMEFLAYGKIPTDNGPVETTFQARTTRQNETVLTAPNLKHSDPSLPKEAAPAQP